MSPSSLGGGENKLQQVVSISPSADVSKQQRCFVNTSHAKVSYKARQ